MVKSGTWPQTIIFIFMYFWPKGPLQKSCITFNKQFSKDYHLDWIHVFLLQPIGFEHFYYLNQHTSYVHNQY